VPERSGRAGLTAVLAGWTRSTSKRDFAVVPVLVLLGQPVRRRRLRPAGLVPMALGFLLYRLSGRYRHPRAGGGSGLSGPPPDRLVTTGIYALTRNPMYTGHLIYLAGLAWLTSSPSALAFALANVPWFQARVQADEQRLLERFGEPCARYLSEVPRWGLPRASRRTRPDAAATAAAWRRRSPGGTAM
jgi:protein-S-isoprenylcysteine O-methyltransferase Ste14